MEVFYGSVTEYPTKLCLSETLQHFMFFFLFLFLIGALCVRVDQPMGNVIYIVRIERSVYPTNN